ncbi:hypothetical protein EWM62_10000 [Mucilaginibacter terrigena]|jgi:DNA/RNA endonuclease G (NUC1)|uniref:DNA/RNA non-specific endonuclease n=1 Tax=Mucilaginibacter terrigena TaxID=2492395 RepID=A0A4Q5LMG9_9SPHI|nr:DNA/RNA non-specific endonuclease [Mucilaginibacter terrigena]RYU90954.1 hypothetical protein EWM62_10000 [Mucilaginibacter terrigena]
MKRLLLLLYLFTTVAFAQDTITIRHQRYTTTFDTVLKYPVLVHWIVKSSDLCDKNNPRRVERKGVTFKPDPQLKKYTTLQKYYSKNKGNYQRGHNMNAADNSCDIQQMKESFYFSNMTPQTKELNEEVWGDLEDETRRLAKQYGQVEVWCGSYAYKEKMGDVTVPMFCWKILKYNGQEVAYIFPNHHQVNAHRFNYYQGPIESVKLASKLDLKGL